MTDIAQLGIRVDSAQAIKAESDLDRLAMAGQRAEVATERLGNTSTRASGGFRVAAGSSRMLAQQLSQVAQQSAATGNIMQSVAIQAADIGMAFGTVGAVVGTLATIALPALVAMFGGTADSARATQDAIDGMDDAVKAFIAAADAASISTEELAQKYGTLAVEARAALQAMADVALVGALDAVDASIRAVLDDLTEMRDFAASDMLAPAESALVLRDAFDLTHTEAARLRAALEDLGRAQGLESQAAAAAAVQSALLGAYGSAERMPAPLRAAYGQMAQIVARAAEANTTVAKLPGLLSAAASAASSAAGAVASIGSAASNAYGAVSALVGKMYEMAQARAAANASLEQFGAGGLAAQYKMYGQGRAAGEKAVAASNPLYGAPSMGGGGGGGGGRSDTFTPGLEALIESLRTEREIEDEWYQESLAILEDRRAKEILGEQAHKEALVALEEEYQQRIADIESTAAQRRIGQTADLFGALADIASTGGRKAAKAVATFQAIEGTINAYGAAIKALNTPGLTLAGRFAAYASVLGAGLKGVTAINAAGGSASGSIAAQGAAGGGATGGQMQGVDLRIYGADSMTQAIIGPIMDALYEETKRGGARFFRTTFA